MFRTLPLLVILLVASGNSFSQRIDSLLEIQRIADPQEKIYVQFDKNYYNPGETIWFKAYLFTGGEPSEASRSFYAELIDEQGNIITQKTAPIMFSGAGGSFDIDSTFSKNLVYFRGYTVSTLNSDTSFIYTKALRILLQKQPLSKAKPVVPPVLSFLPEGGDCIAGLPCNTAFIATNQQGLPVAISGTVSDNSGNKIASLVTQHDGMGKFSFIPDAGKTYTATWKTGDGKEYTTPLPVVWPRGVSLRLSENDGNARFIINRTADAPPAMKRLHLVGYMNQRLTFKADINLTEKITAGGALPIKELPSGILQMTLFDSSYRPIAERISFVNNYDYEFDGDVFLPQKNVARRGLNQVEITLSDTMPANLSIAITDADLNETTPMDDNIISRMLLTGDLRGKIVNPYYYFFNNGDSVPLHLDLVMLTHGWRRYNWENVLAAKTNPPRWKETNYLTLSGQLTGLPQGSFGSGLQLTGILQTADSAKNFVMLPVDKSGKVFTDGLVFYDKAKLYFNFNKKNLSFDKGMLMIDNGLRKGYTKALPDTITKAGLPDITSAVVSANGKNNKLFLQSGRQLAKANMMENITVTAKAKTTKEKMEDKYVSGLFSGSGNSFDLVNDPLASSYMDIFQYLQGKVAGLQISTGGSEPSLSWRGGTPALYLNEMQTDASMLSGTPVSDIAYVKVFRPGESIVSGGGGGVIAIYTRRGGDAQSNPNSKGLSYVQMNGYSAVKQYYSPDYATPSEKDAYNDVRSTLYWNPSIFLDKTHRRMRLKFYNNDISKRFHVVMEGLNADGKLIHIEKEVGSN